MTSPDKPDELALMMLWVGGDFLVQERTHTEEGGLGFFGGKVREGEDPFDAAVRETKEEIYITGFAPQRPKQKQKIEPIEIESWLVHPFQTSLKRGISTQDIEGRSERINPMDMWHDPRLMEASRAILREVILKPNGINEDGVREVPRLGLS